MVLIAHELLDLLFTPLELDHDLSVSQFDSLASITLPIATVFELFTSILLRLVVLCELLRVECLHVGVSSLICILGTFKGSLHVRNLFVAIMVQLLTQRHISSSKIILPNGEVLAIALVARCQLDFMLVQSLNNPLALFALLTNGVLTDLFLLHRLVP